MTARHVPRLSISNCALPTALDWLVRRQLSEWHHNSSNVIASPAAPSGSLKAPDPSPFWISAKAAFLFRVPWFHGKRLADGERKVIDGGGHVASQKTSTVEEMFFVNWDRAVTAFGALYVNAADTSFCSLLDSTTCLSHVLPVDEAGDILWSLLHTVRDAAILRADASRDIVESPCRNAVTWNAPLRFHSPYWLEFAGLEKRWKGVSIARNTSPFYHEVYNRWFINAEQTTDASRFDALSCGPHRRHQCVSVSGVYQISWELSEKLSEAFFNMKKTAAEVSHDVQQQQESDRPNNLWLDVELVEMAGWSLHEAAVGVEVPFLHMTRGMGFPVKEVKKQMIVVNAEFVTQREELLDLIAYKPDCFGLEEGVFIDSAALFRLALLSRRMNYTSSTWICATLAEREGLCGRRDGEVTGVEVATSSHRRHTNTSTAVLINTEELNLSEGRIAELRDCDPRRAFHALYSHS